MNTKVHPLFPTRIEVNTDPNLAYSDHLPILAKVPLGEGNKELNIISLNILGGTDCSGIHDSSFVETDEALLVRYKRIADGLSKGVKLHSVDMIVLQEASKDIVPFLKEHLGDHWDIMVDPSGIISCYNKQRLTQKDTAYDDRERVRSLTFEDQANNSLLIDVHNIWGIYTPVSYHMENTCRKKLTQTQSAVSIIIGDTNSRIAPVDDTIRNLTTGVVPAMFNGPMGIDRDVQIADHPDGGFYRNKAGEIHQLTTEVLDFTTGEVVHDNRSPEEVGAWAEYRMIMCLDNSYKERIIVDGKNIFDYEASLRKTLNAPNLQVRLASDIFNNKGIGICFPARSTVFPLLEKRLSAVSGFQFRDVEDGAKLFKGIFAPLDKIELLHQEMYQITHPEAWLTTIKGQLLDKLDGQINKLSTSHWYFRDAAAKIERLELLKEQIEMATPTSTKEDFLQIVETWEGSEATNSEQKNTNKELIGVHRNIFFSAQRPDVKTATELMLQEMKDSLGASSGFKL